jgi:hypothetical protein
LPVTGTLELSAVYLYDAFNRRVTSILVDPSVSETQLHTWDGWQQATQHRIEQQQPSGQWVATPTKQFVWGSQLDELVAYRRLSGGAWQNYYLLHGGQETAAKLVDAAGNVVETYEYDPYGRVSVYVGSSATAVAASAAACRVADRVGAGSVGRPLLWRSIFIGCEQHLSSQIKDGPRATKGPSPHVSWRRIGARPSRGPSVAHADRETSRSCRSRRWRRAGVLRRVPPCEMVHG